MKEKFIKHLRLGRDEKENIKLEIRKLLLQ